MEAKGLVPHSQKEGDRVAEEMSKSGRTASSPGEDQARGNDSLGTGGGVRGAGRVVGSAGGAGARRRTADESVRGA